MPFVNKKGMLMHISKPECYEYEKRDISIICKQKGMLILYVRQTCFKYCIQGDVYKLYVYLHQAFLQHSFELFTFLVFNFNLFLE